MGVGAFYRHMEHLTGENIGGSHTAADHGCPGSVDTCIRALGAPQAEFHDAVSLGCIHYPGGFWSDQALVVQDIQQSCLNKLGFHNRGDHLHQRFSWEYDGSLRNGIDIPGNCLLYTSILTYLVLLCITVFSCNSITFF